MTKVMHKEAYQLVKGDFCIGPGLAEEGEVDSIVMRGRTVRINWVAGQSIIRPTDYQFEVLLDA